MQSRLAPMITLVAALLAPGVVLTQCPANSSVYDTQVVDGRTLHKCRCDSGFAKAGSACIQAHCLKPMERLENARAGVVASEMAMRSIFEAGFVRRLFDAIEAVPQLGDLADLVAFAEALRTADNAILDQLDQVRAQKLDRAEEKAAIRNFNTFRRLVRETEAELVIQNCVPAPAGAG
jgi:hypothetical protein